MPPLKLCIDGVHRHIADAVRAEHHNAQDQPIANQPLNRHTPLRQFFPDVVAPLLKDFHDKDHHQGQKHHQAIFFVQTQREDGPIPQRGKGEFCDHLSEHGQPGPQAIGPEKQTSTAVRAIWNPR